MRVLKRRSFDGAEKKNPAGWRKWPHEIISILSKKQMIF
jgi:hypothetical protein